MSTCGRRVLCSLAVLATLLAGCVVVPRPPAHPAPPPALPLPPPPPPPREPFEELRRCRADNQRMHAETLDLYSAASRSGRIDPVEAQQFQAMEARLRNLRADLGRDGLSLHDCQRIGAAIAREREEVARMSRRDPGLGRCLSEARRDHQDAGALYEQARRAGRISPREAQQFNAMEARLANLRAELARDGLSMADCQRISAAVARERAEIERMARHEPGVGRCVAENRQAHDDVHRVYAEAQRAGRIRSDERRRFAAIEKRLADIQAALRRDGLTPAECQRIGEAIARERALVDEMAR